MNDFAQHQAETAERLGYRTADEMNAEHDPLHEKLCKALGLPYSPTLEAVQTGGTLDHDWVRYEEDMVLAAQRFLNAWRQLRARH